MSQQSNPATLREADLRKHIANLLRVYRTALRFIKTCHEQKAWPRDLLITEENSNVIERAEAALRQSAAAQAAASPEGEGREADDVHALFEKWWDFADATLAVDLKEMARDAFCAGWACGEAPLRQSAAPSGGTAPTRAEAEVWLEQNGYPYLEQLFNEFVDGPITRSRMNSLLAPMFAQFALAQESKTGAVTERRDGK